MNREWGETRPRVVLSPQYLVVGRDQVPGVVVLWDIRVGLVGPEELV